MGKMGYFRRKNGIFRGEKIGILGRKKGISSWFFRDFCDYFCSLQNPLQVLINSRSQNLGFRGEIRDPGENFWNSRGEFGLFWEFQGFFLGIREDFSGFQEDFFFELQGSFWTREKGSFWEFFPSNPTLSPFS